MSGTIGKKRVTRRHRRLAKQGQKTGQGGHTKRRHVGIKPRNRPKGKGL